MIDMPINQNVKVKSQNCRSNDKSDLKLRCYSFGLEIINYLETLPNKNACWVIADQLLRSSTSIGANLFEARAASSRREFKKFLEISLKSANETKYWLGLLKDSHLAEVDKSNCLLVEVTEIANMLAASVIKLKTKS